MQLTNDGYTSVKSRASESCTDHKTDGSRSCGEQWLELNLQTHSSYLHLCELLKPLDTYSMCGAERLFYTVWRDRQRKHFSIGTKSHY